MVAFRSYWEKLRSRPTFYYTFGFTLFVFIFIFLFPVIASPADVSLAWDANTETDLAGYRIYYKTAFSGPPYDGTDAMEGYSPIILPIEELDDSDYPEYTIHGLSNAETYFFAVTAYNTEEYESGYSNEVYQLCSHIEPPTADAAFSAVPITGYEPLTVDFYDESFGDIVSWSWDFGDNGNNSEQNPFHIYDQAGTYTVRLIVSGLDGCDVETLTDFITVEPNATEVDAVVVETVETGAYETTGKGKNKITSFILASSFYAGDDVVVQAYIVDNNGSPLENATVEITIDGPQIDVITSGPSNADGIAEANWKTSAPKGTKGKGKNESSSGTSPGDYKAIISNVMAIGYVWDSKNISTTFVIQ